MASLKLIRILIYTQFAFILLGQVKCQFKEACPEDHRCRERNMCRPSSMKLIRGKPTLCGISNRGRQNICCPEKSKKPIPPRLRSPNTAPLIADKGNDIRIGTPHVKHVPLNPGDCGISFGIADREGYVMNGEKAEQGTWPWMVAIMEVDKRGVQSSMCTGYLIDKRHVLTAAHCFTGKRGAECTGYLNIKETSAYCFQGKKYSTRIGHVDLTLGYEYPINLIIVHKGYKKGQYYNDIALIVLSKDVNVPNFNPICLPTSPSFSQLTGLGTTVAGWGATTPGGPTSLILRQLSLMPVVSNALCESMYRRKVDPLIFNRQFPRGISSKMLCAGFLDEPGKDSCMGDSGGPLMMQKEDRWYAVGIVSFGYECGKPEVPGGYTRVSEYMTWIDRKTS